MGISWAVLAWAQHEGCRNSLQGFAVRCLLLTDGCCLMAAGCWAVHESELNEGCKNSPLDIWMVWGDLWVLWKGPWGQLVRA